MSEPNRAAVEAALKRYREISDLGCYSQFAAMESALTASLPHLAPQPTLSDEERARILFQDELAVVADDDKCIAMIASAFAAVRAEATIAGAVAERETCAKECDGISSDADRARASNIKYGADQCAAAIRTRSTL